MFRLGVVLLFTSLYKCFGGSRFCSEISLEYFWDKLESAHCLWIYKSDLPVLGCI